MRKMFSKKQIETIAEDAVERNNPALEKLSVDSEDDSILVVNGSLSIEEAMPYLTFADTTQNTTYASFYLEGNGLHVEGDENTNFYFNCPVSIDHDFTLSSGKAIKSGDNAIQLDNVDNNISLSFGDEGIAIGYDNAEDKIVFSSSLGEIATNDTLYLNSSIYTSNIYVGDENTSKKIYLNGNELVPGTKLYKHEFTMQPEGGGTVINVSFITTSSENFTVASVMGNTVIVSKGSIVSYDLPFTASSSKLYGGGYLVGTLPNFLAMYYDLTDNTGATTKRFVPTSTFEDTVTAL